jgi:hypothetical protein
MATVWLAGICADTWNRHRLGQFKFWVELIKQAARLQLTCSLPPLLQPYCCLCAFMALARSLILAETLPPTCLQPCAAPPHAHDNPHNYQLPTTNYQTHSAPCFPCAPPWRRGTPRTARPLALRAAGPVLQGLGAGLPAPRAPGSLPLSCFVFRLCVFSVLLIYVIYYVLVSVLVLFFERAERPRVSRVNPPGGKRTSRSAPNFGCPPANFWNTA